MPKVNGILLLFLLGVKVQYYKVDKKIIMVAKIYS